MDGLFDHIQFWQWWVLAMVMFILEVFSPAAIFMWIGFAAAIMGFILLAAPEMAWETQFLLFAALSVAAIFLGRLWFRKKPIATDRPGLNQRGVDLIGQVFPVTQAIKNGTGRIKVGDSSWKAIGPDSAVGERVRVVAVESAALKVEHD